MTQNRWVRELHVGLLAYETYDISSAIDRETFDVMWELSAPGAAAEHCFLQVTQTDYLLDGRDECLNWMPDVRPCFLLQSRKC